MAIFNIGVPSYINLTGLPDRGNTCGVLVAFVESAKYVGHMVPIALFRMLVGGFYIHEVLAKFHQGFLVHPTLAEEALQWIPRNLAPDWYQTFLNMILVPNWRAFSALVLLGFFLVGVSYVFGYLVRASSVLGFVLCWNMMWIMGPDQAPLFKTYMFIHLMLGLMGAGRCLGIDYYFFKRRRGIWW